jgi:hypothetical protein
MPAEGQLRPAKGFPVEVACRASVDRYLVALVCDVQGIAEADDALGRAEQREDHLSHKD